jgi:hypothetical protein
LTAEKELLSSGFSQRQTFDGNMDTLASIHEKVFENSDAKRIVMKLDTNRLDSDNYANSAKTVLNEIFPGWENDSRILFRAIIVHVRRTFMAIDINHHDYNFATAHIDEKPIPAYCLLRNKQKWTFYRMSQKEDIDFCQRLARLHQSHGYKVYPPLVEDCTSVIVHSDPR